MASRKWTDREEREIAIAYLCGADKDYIRSTLDVGKGVIWESILNGRLREWKDPLVEFYRYRNIRNRLLNALHFHLAFNGFSVENVRLVDPYRDDGIYSHLENCIYSGIKKDAADRAKLEKYLEPVNGFERLARKWFKLKVEDIVDPAFSAAVASELEKRPNYKRISEATAREIAKRVKEGHLSIMGKKSTELKNILGSLTSKQWSVISVRYGFKDNKFRDYVETANKLGINRDEAESYELRAFRMLSDREGDLIYKIAQLTTDKEIEDFTKKRKIPDRRKIAVRYLDLSLEARSSLDKYNIKTAGNLLTYADEELDVYFAPSVVAEIKGALANLPQIESDLRERLRDKGILAKHIEDAGFDMRTCNCLESIGVYTVGDVTRKREEQLLNIQGFGEASLEEVKGILSKKGLSLRK